MPLLALMLFLGLFANASVASGEKVVVAATTFPLAELARGVVGGEGRVVQIVPPGADPHSWSPAPSARHLVAEADVLVYSGARLEPWARRLLESMKHKPAVLDCTTVLPEAGGDDPHVWLDLSIDVAIVQTLSRLLGNRFPSRKAVFQENAARLINRLNELDRLFASRLKNCRHQTVVVAGHAAFGRLLSRYGLHQVALEGLSPDAHASARRLAEIISLVRRSGLPAIFFIKGESPKAAKVIAKETGARPLALSTGAVLTRSDIRKGRGFLKLLEEDLLALEKGLQCVSPSSGAP